MLPSRTTPLMMLLALFSTAAGAQDQSVTVTLKSYDFTPEMVNLMAGTPYRLHLVNDSGRGHSFSAPEFFANATVDDQDQSKIVKGTVEVAPDSSVDVRVRPGRPGSYALRCDHFLHALFGMTGRIVVQ